MKLLNLFRRNIVHLFGYGATICIAALSARLAIHKNSLRIMPLTPFFACMDAGKGREQERKLRYASRTLRTTLQAVQLRILG